MNRSVEEAIFKEKRTTLFERTARSQYSEVRLTMERVDTPFGHYIGTPKGDVPGRVTYCFTATIQFSPFSATLSIPVELTTPDVSELTQSLINDLTKKERNGEL